MSHFLSRIPVFIKVLFVADLFFAIMYFLMIGLLGRNAPMTWLFDVNRESAIPTWYSAIQLFLVGVVMAPLAWHEWNRSRITSTLLWMFPALFLAMSLDEVAMIHEWAGENLDEIFIAGGDREYSKWFRGTGVWVLFIPLPFLAVLLFLSIKLRHYFADCPRAIRLFFSGVGIFLLGAVGSEYIYNLIPWFGIEALLQILSEEFAEMVGVTLMLWAAWEVFTSKGFAIHMPLRTPTSVACTVAPRQEGES